MYLEDCPFHKVFCLHLRTRDNDLNCSGCSVFRTSQHKSKYTISNTKFHHTLNYLSHRERQEALWLHGLRFIMEIFFFSDAIAVFQPRAMSHSNIWSGQGTLIFIGGRTLQMKVHSQISFRKGYNVSTGSTQKAGWGSLLGGVLEKSTTKKVRKTRVSRGRGWYSMASIEMIGASPLSTAQSRFPPPQLQLC